VTSSLFAGLQSGQSGIAGMACRAANEKIQCIVKVNCIEYPAHRVLFEVGSATRPRNDASSVFVECIMAQSGHHGQ
jgi:hypothetical protein